MSTLIKSNISQALGNSLIEDIFFQKSNYYYGLGRTYPWADEGSPDAPKETENYDKLSRNDIVLVKKIEGTSLSFIIDRVDYKAGVVYDIYDDETELVNKNFYVLNSEFNVYKCLYNRNRTPSLVEPFGTSSKSITYSDGYVWKFVYNIPPALRNKFLTPNQMPVYNAITTKYYSRGSINSIIINAAGSNYPQNSTTALVIGDGYLEFNPQKIITGIVSVHGSGYLTEPVTEMDDPVSNFTLFSPMMSVIKGQSIKVSDISGSRFYKAQSAGVLGAVAPSHYYSVFNNGTTPLRHIGTKPIVTSTVDPGAVGSVIIIDQGFGYPELPIVTKSGTGSGAILTPIISGGSVVAINATESGSGYNNQLVAISSPYPLATVYASNTAYSVGTILKYVNSLDAYYYRVDVAGTTGASGPSHITGSQLNGTALLTIISKEARASAILGIVSGFNLFGDIESIKIQNGGSGYFTGSELGNPSNTNPAATVVISGGNPIIPAQATAIINNGVIQKIVIVNSGYGYQSNPVITITGNGSGATAASALQYGYGYSVKPIIKVSQPPNTLGITAVGDTTIKKTEAIIEPIITDGRIQGIKVIDGGVGYTTAEISVIGSGSGAILTPTFVSGDLSTIQAQSELFTIPGTISSVKVISGGSNISSINVSVQGDGAGAVITPIVSNGKLTEIRVLEEGSGYTYANISIAINSTGTAPVVRAILSPVLGHGYNPVKELYTKSIALYGTFSKETNNGFPIENQFRQISIIKNPLKYGKNLLTTDKNGSTCFVISALTNGIPLAKNMILNNNANGLYRVVDFTSQSILIQSLTNSVIVAGDSLTTSINNNNYTVFVTTVTSPSIDKNSGELLFVDNIKAFAPSNNQTVSINTVINLL